MFVHFVINRLVYMDVYGHFHGVGDNPLLILKMDEDAVQEFEHFTDNNATFLNRLWEGEETDKK